MRGTVPENILKRSITKHLPKNSSAFKTGPGADHALLSDDTVLASGFAGEEIGGELTAGETAYIIAANNLATGHASPGYMMIYITAGRECPEEKLRKEMLRMSKLAADRAVAVAGGNTAFAGEGDSYSVTVTLIGKKKEEYGEIRRPQISDCIITVGAAGHFGISRLIEARYEELKKRFGGRFLKNACMDMLEADITATAELLGDRAFLLHDISYGGCYRTYKDLSEMTGYGVRIIHEGVPVRQDTIEISEYFGINPYQLLGIGGFTAVVDKDAAEQLTQELRDAGYAAAVSGQLTESNDKVVISERYELNRFLTPYKEDEIYKVL